MLVDASATLIPSLASTNRHDSVNLSEGRSIEDSRGWGTTSTSLAGLTGCRRSIDGLTNQSDLIFTFSSIDDLP